MDKNEIMLQGFEWNLPADGEHWNRLAAMAPSMKRAGITSIWLPPAYKGIGGAEEVGYAVYDPYDLGEFDQCGSVRTKYGTLHQYTEAIEALHRSGIKAFSDMVMNHRMGAEKAERVKTHVVSTDNRLDVHPEVQDSVLYTKFTFPGRKGRYSNFKWDSRRFTSVSYDKKDPDHQLFLIDGKSFATDVDGELGNYDYLMGCDVDVNQNAVKKELIRWAMFTLDKTGEDGFRLDAVKHISASFMEKWLTTLRSLTGMDLYTVGEYWSSSLPSLLNYLKQVHSCMSLFDVPLHFRLYDAARSDGNFDMGSLLNDTLSKADPAHAVTFVDNHDTQPGQSLESFVSGWFKEAAYGIILLRGQGIPCVFWGDLYGMPYQHIKPVRNLRLLMRACGKYAYGQLYDYFDHQHVVGFTRIGDAHPGSGLAFLCSNQGDGEKQMFVGKEHAGKTFVPLHGQFPPVRIDSEGMGIFRVSDKDFSLYVPEKITRRRRTNIKKRAASSSVKRQVINH